MVHHWWCSKADHSAQFDANLLYCALTLAEVHNAGLLKSQPPTELDARWGYRLGRGIYTKSCLTVQKPSGYSTFHFILLIFHILAPAMLWPNASAWVAGIWMRVHIYPFTWMSVGSSSKQYTSPPETSPLLTSLGSELACYKEEEEEEEGSKAKENKNKNPMNRSPITNSQNICRENAGHRGWRIKLYIL